MTTYANYCSAARCERYRGPIGPEDDPVFVCQAFPLGIPQEILDGKNKHLKPYPGDDGLTYKERE